MAQARRELIKRGRSARVMPLAGKGALEAVAKGRTTRNRMEDRTTMVVKDRVAVLRTEPLIAVMKGERERANRAQRKAKQSRRL